MSLIFELNSSIVVNRTLNECGQGTHDHIITGPVHFILAYLVPIVAVLGMIGNCLTLVTLNFDVDKERKKTSLFLSSKAVADIGVGIYTILLNLNLYRPLIGMDNFNRVYNHQLSRPMYALVNWHIMASTWYAVAVTFERMFAIGWPLRARHTLTTNRICACIFLIAVISFAMTIYPVIVLTPTTFPDCKNPGKQVYGMQGPKSHEQLGLWYYGLVARFLHHIVAILVPVILLFIFNFSIVWHLRRHTRSLTRFTDAGYNLKDAGEQVRISLVVLTITATTAVFLLPSASVLVYDYAFRSSGKKPIFYQTFVHATNLLVLCDKVLDFFLYCLVSGNFRNRLRAACSFRRCGNKQRRRSSGSRGSIDTGYMVMSMCDGRRRSKDSINGRLSVPL